MKITTTIIRKGWRANDTLLERDDGSCLLTFYTRKRTKLTTGKEGWMLYRNQRIFPNNEHAITWYYLKGWEL